MLGFFVINIFVAMLWMVLQSAFSVIDFAVGFLLGTLLLSLVRPAYGRRSLTVPTYVLTLLHEIVRSSVTVARHVVQRNPPNRSGLISIPLDIETPIEIALLASSITLPPGTISVDLDQGADGRRVLLVHALQVSDPEALRREIKDGFERQILAITRGRRPA